MASLMERAGAFLYRVLSVPVPDAATKPTGPAIYRVVKGDGVTSTPGATARPNVNADALRGKDTDIPEASTELFKLSAEIARGNKR